MSEWLKRLRRHPLWVALGALAAVCLWLALGGGGAGTDTAASSEERRIAEVLSAMAGAGKVEVALHYAAEETTAFGGAAGAKPSGAVVVAEGAGELNVRLALIRAMRTLLGLPESAVDVFEMKEAGK